MPFDSKGPYCTAFWKDYLSETKFGCNIVGDWCWSRYAKVHQNANYCLNIKQEKLKSNCITGLIARTHAVDLCESLNDKTSCFLEAAQVLHDDLYCEKAGYTTTLDSAQGWYKGTYCYGYAVLKSKRYDLCENIFLNTQRDQCLQERGIQN